MNLRHSNITITNAEILSLRATPKELVAAPGAGKILQFVSLVTFFDYTAVYTGLGGELRAKYGDGSGPEASGGNLGVEAIGFFDQTSDCLKAYNLYGGVTGLFTKTQTDNKALVLHNTHSSEWTGGNAANVLRVQIAYRILLAGW